MRCRPLSDREKKLEASGVVTVLDGRVVQLRDPGHFADNIMRKSRVRDRHYAFDNVFGEDSTNLAVYEATARHLVPDVLDGKSATVFAYGCTGSGKTFSMVGQPGNEGIMVRVLHDLWAAIETARAVHGKEVTAKLSFIEIYNENIRDLTVERSDSSGPGSSDSDAWLDLREDPVRGPCVAGVLEHDVATAADVMGLLAQGNKRRTQEPTAANLESSRSHAILQIVVQCREKFGTTASVGKLSLIDLAGSERAANTQNRGIRLLEGANINRSLLALGNVINALTTGKSSFVPYRDSKLTRLLKDSLGGATKTIMICCISPAGTSFEERCVARARAVTCRGVTPSLTSALHVRH